MLLSEHQSAEHQSAEQQTAEHQSGDHGSAEHQSAERQSAEHQSVELWSAEHKYAVCLRAGTHHAEPGESDCDLSVPGYGLPAVLGPCYMKGCWQVTRSAVATSGAAPCDVSHGQDAA